MNTKNMSSVFFVFMFVCVSSVFPQDDSSKKILLGFVQVSSEGTWRMANTQSVKDSAAKEGVELIFREGQNNYTNQSKEMSDLIASGVDVLAFSPSQVEGWDGVLQEAKDVGIPVIVLDRAIDVKDSSLYVTHIGSDMIDEGRRAAKWLVSYLEKQGKLKEEMHILVLEGVKGSTPAEHRDRGFREVLATYPNLKIVHSEPADFIMSKGQEITERVLKSQKIDIIFAHNDEMALGAVDAVKSAGKVPGKDVIIIGVDGIKKALEAIVSGSLNATIECSPLLGPQLMKAVKDLSAGKTVEKNVVTEEKDFDISNAQTELPKRVY